MRKNLNYLVIRVALIDGKSGEEVASTLGYLGTSRSGADWMDSKNLALTDSNATSTKSGIEHLIEELLRKSLADMKLAQLDN